MRSYVWAHPRTPPFGPLMHVLRLLLLPLLLFPLALPGMARAEAGAVPADLVKARLAPEVSEIAPGQPFTVGVHLTMKDGWHVYWRNPGDSGQAVRLEWELPEGFSASEIRWPAPELIMVGPVANFGFHEEVTLLVDITPPAELAPGSEIPLGLKASWLVCDDECLPGEATLDVKLKAAESARKDPRHTALFAAARASLPLPSPWPVALEKSGDELLLRVDEPALGSPTLKAARFFPNEDGAVANAAEQPLEKTDEGLTLRLTVSHLASDFPTVLEGVLVLEEQLSGDAAAEPIRQAFDIDVKLEQAAPSPMVATAGEPSSGTGAGTVEPAGAEKAPLGLLEVILFALLGGIILNLMPCVFPVLSLKVLGVVQQAGEDSARIKLHGIAYTAGILASFALLAGMLLLLRAGGAEIGWGFQLQSPVFVTVLAYVMLVMGLSLSGVFEMGNSIMGVGSRLAAKQGLTGSFFTGVVATVVATPCTAPFMGAAVGFALIQPAAIAIGIFLALGFGLALPFLALSFAPQLVKKMPRPGQWMVTLKEALAFPLYGTVAWLVWVLHAQIGPDGLAAVLAGLVLVALAAWAFGRSRPVSGKGRLVGNAVTLLAVLGAVGLLRLPAVSAAVPGGSVASAGAAAGELEPWTSARLDELLEEGKPVFVNMTAAWCVTCLVNERTALSTDGVKRAFKERGVTYLKGDWTNEDPEITRFLARFGRSGVPLYLFYPEGKKDPVVLPQVLTESIVLGHLEES